MTVSDRFLLSILPQSDINNNIRKDTKLGLRQAAAVMGETGASESVGSEVKQGKARPVMQFAGPVQNKNAKVFIQKLSRISG